MYMYSLCCECKKLQTLGNAKMLLDVFDTCWLFYLSDCYYTICYFHNDYHYCIICA